MDPWAVFSKVYYTFLGISSHKLDSDLSKKRALKSRSHRLENKYT